MMNVVMMVLIVLSLVFGALLGNMNEVTGAVLESGVSAVKLCVELAGTVALWSGVMQIAENCGLCAALARAMSPVTDRLFPSLRVRCPRAVESISMNITANLLGLGSAATPMALDAMTELDRLNGSARSASDDMIVFVVLNTASIQLMPTTVATIRRLAGSPAPMEIVGCVWLSTIGSVLVAVGLAKALCRRKRKREGRHGIR